MYNREVYVFQLYTHYNTESVLYYVTFWTKILRTFLSMQVAMVRQVVDGFSYHAPMEKPWFLDKKGSGFIQAIMFNVLNIITMSFSNSPGSSTEGCVSALVCCALVPVEVDS